MTWYAPSSYGGVPGSSTESSSMAGGSEVAVDRTTRSEPNRRADDVGPVALKVAFQPRISTFTGAGKEIKRDFESPSARIGSIGPRVQITGPQPLAGKQVIRVPVRDHGLNPCLVMATSSPSQASTSSSSLQHHWLGPAARCRAKGHPSRPPRRLKSGPSLRNPPSCPRVNAGAEPRPASSTTLRGHPIFRQRSLVHVAGSLPSKVTRCPSWL